jgi:hypothetical protein
MVRGAMAVFLDALLGCFVHRVNKLELYNAQLHS